jgi:hypothetical protein
MTRRTKLLLIAGISVSLLLGGGYLYSRYRFVTVRGNAMPLLADKAGTMLVAAFDPDTKLVTFSNNPWDMWSNSVEQPGTGFCLAKLSSRAFLLHGPRVFGCNSLPDDFLSTPRLGKWLQDSFPGLGVESLGLIQRWSEFEDPWMSWTPPLAGFVLEEGKLTHYLGIASATAPSKARGPAVIRTKLFDLSPPIQLEEVEIISSVPAPEVEDAQTPLEPKQYSSITVEGKWQYYLVVETDELLWLDVLINRAYNPNKSGPQVKFPAAFDEFWIYRKRPGTTDERIEAQPGSGAADSA